MVEPDPRSAPVPDPAAGPPVVSVPGPPGRPGQPGPAPANRAPAPRQAAQRPAQRPAGAPRMTTGRPSHFPSGFAWLAAGLGRRWRGVGVALVSTWLGLPFAIFLAVFLAVLLGIAGLAGGADSVMRWVPAFLVEVPLLGTAVDAVAPAVGGAVGALIGVGLGLGLGFLGAFQLLWWGTGGSDDPLAGLGSAATLVVLGLVVGLLYTLYRVVFEGMILRATGARRLSRREAALILPLVGAAAGRLGLPDHPPILIDDSDRPVAATYIRHIVLHRGLLDEFEYDPEVIAGVLSHELVHWRNGDQLAAAFIRGVALPLYAIHLALGALSQRAERSFATAVMIAPVKLLAWLVFWPVVATVRWVIVPVQSAEVRKAEFRADQGAERAGYRDGLRQVLERLEGSFEAGRDGWDQVVATAAHPANELRLERLEDEPGSYPLQPPAGRGGS